MLLVVVLVLVMVMMVVVVIVIVIVVLLLVLVLSQARNGRMENVEGLSGGVLGSDALGEDVVMRIVDVGRMDVDVGRDMMRHW